MLISHHISFEPTKTVEPGPVPSHPGRASHRPGGMGGVWLGSAKGYEGLRRRVRTVRRAAVGPFPGAKRTLRR